MSRRKEGRRGNKGESEYGLVYTREPSDDLQSGGDGGGGCTGRNRHAIKTKIKRKKIDRVARSTIYRASPCWIARARGRIYSALGKC